MNIKQFNKLKESTSAKYEKLDKVFCPALKADIYFSSDGWHHLRYHNDRKVGSEDIEIG